MSSDVSSIYYQDNINSSNPNNDGIYKFENFRLDASHLMLYENEAPITLAPKVIETLVALVERGGEVISKDELMERLWGDSFVEESNLTQNVYLLRKTLGNNSGGKPLIETFRRRGYRFTGEFAKSVENQNTEKSDAQTGNNKNEADNFFDSLAVLPLTNESKNETAEYLSDGITESIINRLSQLEDFRVVARNTVFRYKNQKVEPQKIGRELGVSAVLTGRILQFGERLIVRTELTETTNGWQIWGEQYDCFASDVLELQETIAREISDKLHLKLSREEQKRLTKRDTKSSDAYQFYIKGRHFLNRRSIKSIERATEYFQQAIDIDVNYALAFVGLADCYPLLSLYGALPPHEAYPKAAAAARTALKLDENLAEAHNSLGVVKSFYEWDWQGAETAFRKALEINPGYADAHQRFGMFLISQERFDEAIVEFECACRLDPLSLITKTISGYPFYYSRQFEKAAACFSEVSAMDENYSMAHFRLGLTYAQSGKFEAAAAELGKSTLLSNDRDVVAALGYIHGLNGDFAKARAALDELDKREDNGFVSAYNKVLIYAGLDENETALDWLEKAYEERSYWLIYLKSDPSLDSLRTDSRFIALQEKMFGAKTNEMPRLFNENRQIASAEKQVSRRNIWVLATAFGLLILASFGWTQFNRSSKNSAAQISKPTLKRLTPDINAINPAISPDGKYLVYIQKEEAQRSLWVKELATGSAKQIMPMTGEGYEMPVFSPDGNEIYYATSRLDVPNSIIERIPATGGTRQEIVRNVMSPFTISPDGKQLAFVRLQSLIIAETDGSGERVLSERDYKTKWFESWGSQLSWSPDGKTIAICGGRNKNGQRHFELTEISVADASERNIPVPDWNYLDSVQWLPDRSGLVVIAKETSGSPFQIWRVAYPSGEAARITQDFQDYHSVSISADSRLLIASQEIGNRNIWTAPIDNARAARKITSGTAANDGYGGISLMPDGRIVYTSPRSGNTDLWIMNADGSAQKQLTANAGENVQPDVSPNGRYIFFKSDRNNAARIWRIDADGGNPKQLTDGEGFQEHPMVSADEKWVYFTTLNGTKSSIWKTTPDGDKPFRVTMRDNVSVFSISPDGKLLVFQQYDQNAPKPWQFGVMSAETGEVVKMFDQPMAGRMRWTADSKSVIYIEAGKYVNLWQQPIGGSKANQLTDFDAEQLRAFDISADGKTLVASRGNSTFEAVLIENF